MHPGAAVVVDGESVSTEKVDDLADKLCEAVSASGQSGVGGSDVRQQAASLMLNLTAARQATDDLGIEVEPSKYALTGQDSEMIESQFPDADTSNIETLIKISKETSALVSAIGEEESGETGEKAQQAGQQFLQKYIADADVDVDARYGLDGDNKPTDVESLSVRVSKAAEDAPPSQQCA